MAALGVWILWLGWFGFNGGSELVVSNESAAIAVSQVFMNTNMAACGGVVAAILTSLIMTGKMDVTMAMNGAIAGLVAITAGPSAPSGGEAVLIGAIGGVLVYFSILFFDKTLKLDDPVGAISAPPGPHQQAIRPKRWQTSALSRHRHGRAKSPVGWPAAPSAPPPLACTGARRPPPRRLTLAHASCRLDYTRLSPMCMQRHTKVAQYAHEPQSNFSCARWYPSP